MIQTFTTKHSLWTVNSDTKTFRREPLNPKTIHPQTEYAGGVVGFVKAEEVFLGGQRVVCFTVPELFEGVIFSGNIGDQPFQDVT